MERSANRKRILAPNYKPNDMVFINTKNFKTKRPCKKLDHKNAGLYPIVKRISQASYEVDLLDGLNVHYVFHSSFLRLDPNDPILGQRIAAPPPVVVNGE